VTLASAPLPLALDGDAVVLTQAMALKFGPPYLLRVLMTCAVPMMGMSVPLMSARELLTALVPHMVVHLPPSVGCCVDSGDDELVDVIAPLLHC
jgi:hypothetical protein